MVTDDSVFCAHKDTHKRRNPQDSGARLTFFNIGEEVSNLRPHVGRGYSHSMVAGGLEEMS